MNVPVRSTPDRELPLIPRPFARAGTGRQDGDVASSETRDGVALSNLDEPLFDGSGATKRDLVDYLDALHRQVVAVLSDRPLSVIRALRGQKPFMQKNVPKYAPEWVATTAVWSAASKRQIAYALCNDRRTLLWFANQRAVEYHPTLFRVPATDAPTHLVLDLDPPEGSDFRTVVAVADLVRQALSDVGLAGAVKTSGSKGVHVFVPVTGASTEAGCPGNAVPGGPGRGPRSRPSLRPPSSRPIGRARSFSTPPGPAAPASPPRTARGCGRARRCRSPSPGPISRT